MRRTRSRQQSPGKFSIRSPSRAVAIWASAVFETKALQEEGAEATRFRQFVNEQLTNGPTRQDTITMGGPPVQAIVAIEMRRPAFKLNFQRVVRQNPELLQMLAERRRLVERYHAIRRGEGRDR